MSMACAACSIPTFLPDVSATKSAKPQALARFPLPFRASQISSPFKCGLPLVARLTLRKFECRSGSVTIKCEQGTKTTGGLDVWLGRLAMVGFATAITIEIVTGKGLLENFGFTTPLPSFALIVTTLIGILTAVFIFQSATRE